MSLPEVAQLVPLSYMEHEHNILPLDSLLRRRVRALSTESPSQYIFTSLTSHLCNLMELLSYCQSILHPICHGARCHAWPDLHHLLKLRTPTTSPINKLQLSSFPLQLYRQCSVLPVLLLQQQVSATCRCDRAFQGWRKTSSSCHRLNISREKKHRKWSFYNNYLTPHPSLRSQQTEEPPGVHQSLRGEAVRRARLPAEGGSAPPTGLHLCRCDWWVPISR